MKWSMRTQISILIGTSLFLALTASLLILQFLGLSHARDLARKELREKTELLSTLIRARKDSQKALTSLLVAEPTLRMTLQLQDAATMRDTLMQIQTLIGHDFVAVFGAEGQLLSSLPDDLAVPPDLLKIHDDAFSKQSLNLSVMSTQGVLIAQVQTVEFHHNVEGFLVTGFLLDLQKLKQFSYDSGLELSIYHDSTRILATYDSSLSADDWLYSSIPLGDNLTLAVAASQSSRQQWIRSLQLVLILMSLTIFVLTLGLSVSLASRFVNPLLALAKDAQNIGMGDFDSPVSSQADNEVQDLARCMESMRQSLKSFTEQLVLTEGLRKEISLAADLQRSLLPITLSQNKEYSLHARLEAAQSVGGDLYFCFPQPHQTYSGVLDVSGHGFAAALLAAMAHGLLKHLCQQNLQPADIIKCLNQALYTELERTESFISICLICTDEYRKITLCSAGHPSPIVCKQGQSFYLQDSSFLLGILEDAEFEQVELSEVERLYIYSDGITEAKSIHDTVFGDDRLLQICAADLPGEEIIQAVFTELESYPNGLSTKDDRTLLVVSLHTI